MEPFKCTATVLVSEPPHTFVAVNVYLNSTSTVALGLVTPPGPVAVSSYAVVCRGEIVLSPVVGTGLIPVISASMVSLDVQTNGEFWLQSILAGMAETV